MKHIPVIFHQLMVKALLNGTKTQTRRLVGGEYDGYQTAKIVQNAEIADPKIEHDFVPLILKGACIEFDGGEWITKSKFNVGDIIWVKENCWIHGGWQKGVNDAGLVPNGNVFYDADCNWANKGYIKEHYKRRSSMLMPKAAARLFYEITAVGVERAQNISEADAIAEGVMHCYAPADGRLYCNYLSQTNGKFDAHIETARQSFASLWGFIHNPESWAENPWVYKLTFKPVNKPANFLVKNLNK